MSLGELLVQERPASNGEWTAAGDGYAVGKSLRRLHGHGGCYGWQRGKMISFCQWPGKPCSKSL
ncbi:hypothetical protein HBI56_119640 [Parastagonospora nodorum]|uniref:Uncharacterized protein n=1 Tax=Phaeosphaeria nodorum (strain SN15 / ATCC MYA-4574 / FGSC 10173) TaxID=321614 RepID=A0A7U2I3U8_PHANO|nr:hypothetical protein HBH56_055120 [Parastagonospora nodorum]QRD02376.1 hypothetical protein JI435_417870 [Parastagonospora nodorum SN15]KAH3935879.1 hypothetical protein HBH54_040920 [Parastagonospora nodorum]KAH3948591.1 hypothetical protein HBH53_098380 [Parastagonospora nodorum]KAH3969874.1 hypothetical protein HBH51_121060 [Parastagonospora nodorum]